MPAFFQLPNEVLSLIVGNLDSQGLINLRLASKHANSITLPTFVKRHFETRYVMLTRASLENLMEISRHRVLGMAVKTVEVCLDHLTDEPSTGCPTSYLGDILAEQGLGPQTRARTPDPNVEGRIAREGDCNAEDDDQFSGKSVVGDIEPVLDRQAYNELLEEQKFMMESGLITASLSQAFSALSSMESVVVNNTHRPWGVVAQRRLTGLNPTNTMDDYDSIEWVKQALLAMFSAIVASKICLRRLDISAGWHEEAISPDMLVFPKPSQRYFRHILASLTTLALTLSPTSRMSGNDRWTSDFLGFMTIFPDIQELELGFGPRDEEERFSHFAHTLRLQNLQSVAIDSVDCVAEDLATFLLNHKDTLKEVHLSCIEIPGGKEVWQSLLFTIRDKLIIRALTMDQCQSGGLDVFYCDVLGDCVKQLNDFTIRTDGDWSDSIEKVTVGRRT